jgi:hypothetical protein
MTRWQTDQVFAARDIVARLSDHIAELPDQVRQASDRLDAITVPPDLVDDNTAAVAIANGATDKAVNEALLQQVLRPAHRAAATKALQIAAQSVLAALAANADEIHEDGLRPVAERLIDEIHAAAQTGDIPLEALVRVGRHEDARRQAELSSNVAQLAELYRLRNAVYGVHRVDVDGLDVSQFHTLATYTSPTRLSDRQTDVARAHSLYARGARYWFPTPAQWQARAKELLPAHKSQQDAIAAAQAHDLKTGFDIASFSV